MAYYCYLMRCADGSFYTGWTLDPHRREQQHNQGRGAKYTRLHRPVKLVYVEEQPDLSSALKREKAIKKLSHQQKEKMAQGWQDKMEISFADLTVVSPGRVNLLGEHVDYNDGLVFPAAIDREVTIRVGKRMDDVVYLRALDLGEEVSFSVNTLDQKIDIDGQPLPTWALYPAGVAWVLLQHGLRVSGMEAEFTSNLPMGAGLSSSAALEVGFAVVWEALGDWDLDRMTLARYAQAAEVQYVGLNCGLMDQFACANGVAGHALVLDIRSLQWRPVPLPAGYKIVIANSMVKHELVGSEYNTRHQECNEAVEIFQRHLPEVHSLRDVSMPQLLTLRAEFPENVFKRARHVISEIGRVQQAVQVLEAGEVKAFGELMYATHASLRDDYAVSCREIDILVEIAAGLPGCVGARLTGGGFGGCTVNLVREEAVTEFTHELKQQYLERTGISAAIFPCQAADGAHVI